MNLQKISDDALISKAESLVGEERETLAQILHHLKEIERRRLFSELGYKSIFDFAVRRLGYSEDQAYRRISAMRLLKELPQIEQQIVSGELSLTNIALAQKVFRQKVLNAKNHATSAVNSSDQKAPAALPASAFTTNDKIEILKSLNNKTKREAEKITLSHCSFPEIIKPDRLIAVAENVIELKFVASSQLREKIEKLKGRFAHKHPSLTLGELFEKLCDEALDNGDAHDQQCEICGSHYALEIDHIVPRAKGGTTTIENLRLLCRSCNQRAAINEFGQLRMDQFIN